MKHVLPLILMFLFCQMAFSQTVVLKPFDAPAAHKQVSYLKEYSLLQTRVKDIQNVLISTPGNIYKLILRTPEHAFQLELYEYSLSAPDRIRTTGGIDNIQRLPARTDLRTFKGTVNGINNSLVSMTIADGFLHLMIDDRSNQYFIDKLEDPTKLFTTEEDMQQFVLYKSSDVLPVPGVSCGSTALNKGLEEAKHQVRIHSDSRNRACLTTFIALASDFTMILKHGGPNGVDNFMMSNLADVQTVFDDEFYYEIEYVLTATYIADMPNTDPFNGINDIFAQLDKFRQIGDLLFAGAGYVVSTCWTSKFTSGAIGVAYLPGVCYADKYNVCSSFIPGSGPQVMYLTLQAHELGHNWNCQHDQLSAGTIMQATINPSKIWSFMSKDAVKNYIEFQGLAGGCLPFCPGSGVPMPDFTSDKVYGCQPMTVKFKDLSTNTTDWKWSFPGGTPGTSTEQNPTVVYRVAGNYEVSLEASNPRCKMSITKLNYIEVNDVPIANFSFGVNGKEVFFIDLSQRAKEYLWNFGDGETSEDPNPQHTYDRDTSYDVTLTVINDCGTHTIKKRVNVVSLPIADFEADTTGGCAPKNIKFIDKSTNNVKKWEWLFTGGNPSVSFLQNPIVRYDNPGTYDVKLTVYSSSSNNKLTKKLYITIDSLPDAEISNSLNGSIATFTGISRYAKTHFWNFGDNTTSTEVNPVHNYNDGRYEVLYIVTNGCGSDTARTVVTIGAKPIAGFQVADPKGCLPFTVQFQNTSTIAATDYRWYFPGGNPSTSIQKNPVVTYNSVGKYNVSLVASNFQYSDSVGYADFIEVKTLPTVNFNNSISGFKSFFTSQASGANSYFWQFGDSKTSTEANPVHDYGVEGEFDVRLIVSNDCGQDTFDKHIAVYLVPKVDFTADTIRGCVPFTVNFKDKSSIDVNEWNWEFENGNPATSTEKNPQVTYTKKGKYAVKLTVKNTNGNNGRTKLQYIVVVSSVLCPEKPKKDRNLVDSKIIEFPFDLGFESRSRINELNEEVPFVYPNPAKDYITVVTEASKSNPVQMELYNLSGSPIAKYKTQETSYKIQTESLRSGTYYLRIQDGSNAVIRKFVISE